MKKSTVAILTLAVLGAGFTGTAWYTGKKAEEEYNNYLAINNQKMAKEAELTGILVQMKNTEFERGIFSSKYSYEVSIQSEEIDWSIPFEGNLYHGPLPLNQLVKFNFKPMIFSSDMKLVENEKTKAVFEITQSSSPLIGEMNMSYTQQLTGYALFKGGKGTWDGVSADWKDINFTFNTDVDGVGKFESAVDKLVFSIPAEHLVNFGLNSQELKAMDIELNNFNIYSDFTKTKFDGLYAGVVESKIDNLRYVYHSDNKNLLNSFELKNLTFDYEGKLDNKDFFDLDFKFDADSFINDKHLAKLKLDTNVNHIAAQELMELNNVHPNNDVEIQRLVLALLKKQPNLEIEPLSFSNDKGKIEANFMVELAENADFDKLSTDLLAVFKEFKFDLEGKEAALTQLASTVLQANGLSVEEAEQKAKEQVTVLLNNMKLNGLLVEKEDKLSLKLALEKEGIRFNGDIIPQAFINMFLMSFLTSLM